MCKSPKRQASQDYKRRNCLKSRITRRISPRWCQICSRGNKGEIGTFHFKSNNPIMALVPFFMDEYLDKGEGLPARLPDKLLYPIEASDEFFDTMIRAYLGKSPNYEEERSCITTYWISPKAASNGAEPSSIALNQDIKQYQFASLLYCPNGICGNYLPVALVMCHLSCVLTALA